MSYSVRRVPETPSASLNSWLRSRYSEPTSSILQYVMATIVCAFYEASTALHRAAIRARSDVDAKTAWMGACGLVGVAVTIAVWLLFTIVVASSFIIHAVLYYAAVIVGFVGLGLGAAGALYFGNDMQASRPAETSGYRSTITSSHDYTRSHNE